ncbi:MAG TPA: thioesterase domain-containing protein [Burkholderiaceae bacterium]
MQKSKWFLIRKPKPNARFRLFCFPYAGGSAASYAAWDEFLPDSIELVAIQPPGRANRMNEGLLTSVVQMAGHIVEAIPPLLDRPYMLYGHSLGSAVSFELLHALKDRGLPLPFKYICGARRAPHNVPRIPPIHDYPLEKFKAELRDSFGMPEVVLNNAELMEIFAPILRTDFKAAYIYVRMPDFRFDFDVAVFGGTQDDKVLMEDMAGWQDHFVKPIDFQVFEGGHMFLDTHRELVIGAIRACFEAEYPENALCEVAYPSAS